MKVTLPRAESVLKVTVTLPAGVIHMYTMEPTVEVPIAPEDEPKAHILVETLGGDGKPNGMLSAVVKEPEPEPEPEPVNLLEMEPPGAPFGSPKRKYAGPAG